MECIVCQHSMMQQQDWLYQCRTCGFEQSTLSSGAGRGVDGLETLRRNNFKLLIGELKQLTPLKNLKCLEVGCAEGWFLEAMTKEQANISAIEASAHAQEMQRKGFSVIHGFFPDVVPSGERYTMIAFNDVFEHLPDPIHALKKCEEHLEAGGYLVINLPNNSGFLYKLSKVLAKFGITKPFDRLWQKDFPSPHMTYFSDTTLPQFVQKYSGLKMVKKFYLPSLSATGLRERIHASYQGITGHIIYAALRVLMPVITLLPQDIMVFVFEKRREQ